MPNSTGEWEVVRRSSTLRALQRRSLIVEPAGMFRPASSRWGVDYYYVDTDVTMDVEMLTTHTPKMVKLSGRSWLMKLQYYDGCFFPFVLRKRLWRQGDSFVCRSGVTGLVITLRQRYDDDIEQLRSCNEIYGILRRLELGHLTPEAAWELNPLTVGTVYPEDFQVVV